MSIDPRTAAQVLARIAAYLELHGENKFKARAYDTAAKSLRGFQSDDVAAALESGELAGLRGLGPATLAFRVSPRPGSTRSTRRSASRRSTSWRKPPVTGGSPGCPVMERRPRIAF